MTTRTTEAGLPLLPAELTEDEVIGERVHMQLFRRRYSQTWLAERMNMTPAAVSRKLRGQRPWLASEVVLVARLLGVAYEELLPGPGQATVPIPPDDTSPVASNGGDLRSSSSHGKVGSSVGVVIRPRFNGSRTEIERFAPAAIRDGEAA